MTGLSVDYKQTRHQVARGTRPDARAHDALLLYKHVSFLRATYQIRLLTFMTLQRGLKLRIIVLKRTKLHPALRDLVSAHRHVKVERSKANESE
jgi:hypothetical protein